MDNISKTPENYYSDGCSGVEVRKRPWFRKPATAFAASLVLALGIGGTVAGIGSLGRSASSPDTDAEVAAQVTTAALTTAATETKTETAAVSAETDKAPVEATDSKGKEYTFRHPETGGAELKVSCGNKFFIVSDCISNGKPCEYVYSLNEVNGSAELYVCIIDQPDDTDWHTGIFEDKNIKLNDTNVEFSTDKPEVNYTSDNSCVLKLKYKAQNDNTEHTMTFEFKLNSSGLWQEEKVSI